MMASMQFPDGFTDVPPGKLAAVVLNLEMRAKPAARPAIDGPWRLVPQRDPDAAWYRTLFRHIGEPYLWVSRLRMTDEVLLRAIRDPQVHLFTLQVDGADEGILELDFRVPGECEIAFLGVTERLVGTRAARFLMNEALDRAWTSGIERVWLHTCTLDHPKAIPFYLRSGFVPYKYQVEILDDPRALGLLAVASAPNIPMVR